MKHLNVLHMRSFYYTKLVSKEMTTQINYSLSHLQDDLILPEKVNGL